MAKSGVCSAAWRQARNAQKQLEQRYVCKVKALKELKRRKGAKLLIAPTSLVPREIENDNYKKTGGRPKLKGKPQCGLCLKTFRDGYDRNFHMLYHNGGIEAMFCVYCQQLGVPEHECYHLNGDSYRKHLNRHGWVLFDLKVSDDPVDNELYELLSLVYPIAADLFNKLQEKAKDYSNPWRWSKVYPHDKNTKTEDLAKCKIWDVLWTNKLENGKFEVTTVNMSSITVRSGVIWGIKELCDKAEIPFKHRFLDATLAPRWFSAYKNEYEIQKILQHFPKSAKCKSKVISYKVRWALGSESTVKVKNLISCKLAVKEYWKK